MIEKIRRAEEKISKIRYVTEFIFSLIFIFFLMQTVYLKNYAGYFHKLYLTGTVIWFLILLINVIYNFKKAEKKIERIFLNIAIPLGLLFLVSMIPGHVPDETTHFIKAYDVSQGHIITPIDENGNSSIEVPKELSDYNYTNVLTYKDLVELAEDNTNYQETEEVVSTAQGYSFIMYIFSGIAFFIVRVLNMSIIWGIILGRIFNFIFFLILAYLAIKKIPFGKLVYAVYMLMPMNLQQVTSISADAFINSILFYYIAFSIYMIFKKEKLNKKEIISYIILTAIAGIVKMVYVLIAGVGFLIVKRKDLKAKNKVLIIALTILIGGAFTLGALFMSGRYTSTTVATDKYAEEFNVDSGKQLEQIIENPEHVIEALKTDWFNGQKEYIFMAIGSQLGWLEMRPSEIIILAYLILLIIAAVSEKNSEQFDVKSKIWLILISIGIVLLVEYAMYTTFTPVGAEFIGGVQGRYYIPIYILLLLCLAKKDNYFKIKNSEYKLLSIAGVLNICVLIEIIQYFI